MEQWSFFILLRGGWAYEGTVLISARKLAKSFVDFVKSKRTIIQLAI